MPKRPAECHFCYAPVHWVEEYQLIGGRRQVLDKHPTGTFCKGGIGPRKLDLYCCPNEECMGKFKALLRGESDHD